MQGRNRLVVTRVARSRTVLGITAVAFLLTGVGMAAPTPAAAAGTSPLPLVLSAPAAPVGDLFPGGVGAAQFTVNNPNPFAARLESLSFGTVRSSDPTGCPATLLGTHPVTLPASDVVPAGATAAAFRVAGAFTLAAQAPDQCQGVTFLVDTTLLANIDGQQISSSAGESARPGASATSPTPGILAYTGAKVLAMAFFGGLLLVIGMAVSGLAALLRRRSRHAGRDG
jgi:hypothetical protein